jgi:hypothetical protein
VQSRNGQSANVQSRNGQAANVQSRNGQSANVQSRNGQAANVRSRNSQQPSSLQSRRTSSLRHGLSTRSLREEDALENPFDQEVPSTSETTFDVDGDQFDEDMEEEEELDEEEEENEEDDNPFVFGNPFDGPLPEVFRYDAELRRSVMEFADEEEAEINSSKAKGKSGSQKTKRLSH